MPDRREELYQTADVSRLLAEELIKRGEYMLELGRKLRADATELEFLANKEPKPKSKVEQVREIPAEDRSLTKSGEVVTFGSAVKAAKELGDFSRNEFAEKLELRTPAVIKWITKLLNNKPYPIIERQGAGPTARYRYIEPKDNAPTERPRHTPPEMEVVDRTVIPLSGITPPSQGSRSQAIPKTSHKDLNNALKQAVKQGWKVTRRQGSNHLVAISPGGDRVLISSTPDESGAVAALRDLHNMGVEVGGRFAGRVRGETISMGRVAEVTHYEEPHDD